MFENASSSDDIPSVAVTTSEGRTALRNATILGIYGGYLWVTQDVTFDPSAEWDYQTVSGLNVEEEEGIRTHVTKSSYKVYRFPMADVQAAHIGTSEHHDDMSETWMILDNALWLNGDEVYADEAARDAAIAASRKDAGLD